MIMSLVFYLIVSYWQKILELEFINWDVNTCTPADYTVKMKISNTQYNNYKEGINNGNLNKDMIDLIEE